MVGSAEDTALFSFLSKLCETSLKVTLYWKSFWNWSRAGNIWSRLHRSVGPGHPCHHGCSACGRVYFGSVAPEVTTPLNKGLQSAPWCSSYNSVRNLWCWNHGNQEVIWLVRFNLGSKCLAVLLSHYELVHVLATCSRTSSGDEIVAFSFFNTINF